LLWIALEALFGPRDPGEVAYRLSQNLALFLEADAARRAVTLRQAKKDYGSRSRIVHGEGGGVEPAEFDRLMDRAQDWVRRALLRILDSPELCGRFSRPDQRDDFFQAALFRVRLE
jgi:hypothetical protein